jgi:hypothetical protein
MLNQAVHVSAVKCLERDGQTRTKGRADGALNTSESPRRTEWTVEEGEEGEEGAPLQADPKRIQSDLCG